MIECSHFRGYNSMDGARRLVRADRHRPEREAIDGAQRPMRLQGPNQWTAEMPEFEPVVLEFRSQIDSGQHGHVLLPAQVGTPICLCLPTPRKGSTTWHPLPERQRRYAITECPSCSTDLAILTSF